MKFEVEKLLKHETVDRHRDLRDGEAASMLSVVAR
jgi:hypothetical protein